jgi:hypothetical protein
MHPLGEGSADLVGASVMLRKLLVAAALAVAAAAPAGAKLSQKAYFDVKIAATQKVNWTRDTVFHGCGGTTGTQGGSGTADLTFDIGLHHWIEARRVPGDTVASFQFEAKQAWARPIGKLSRSGHLSGTTSGTPTGYCPKSDPPQDDCGTLDLPVDAQLGLEYISPAAWKTSHFSGHPNHMSLVLIGPSSRTWSGMPFKFCPGVTGDELLGGTWAPLAGTAAYAGPANLPLSLVFGTKKEFKIHWHDALEDDPFLAMKGLPEPYISAKYPIDTSVDWTVRFTRRTHPPGAS